ncbi:MAG TPA: hypothetical protein PLG38_10575 [Propionibacteriaceae bacterium]|nr:hypothetical protein [Propionibacteriaceae bacterium]
MDVRIAQERAFVLHSSISMEQAKEKAWAQKLNVFGALNNLMFRPKDDDVQITRHELRYEPFWHVAARSELDYDVRETYPLAVKNPTATKVTLEISPDQPLEVRDGQVMVTGITRCRDVQQREQILDGLTGEERPPYGVYLRRPMTELTSLDQFAPPDAVVLAPEIRSSFVVRQQLTSLMKAVHADQFHTELVEVTALALFFRPVYAFDYHWVSKQRQQSMELDGSTGELRNTTRKIGAAGSKLDKDLLFDIGADAVGMIVPGGNIAMKVGKMVVQRTRAQ